MSRLILILKPTVLCNCSCKYCITPTDIPRNRVKIGVIERLCEKLSRSKIYDSFTFIWHGGEPLLMGIDFYKQVLGVQRKFLRKGTYVNTFQSNCTLIDDDWMNFFIENRIRVSTSLDGDKELHDANRIRNGKGTFDETLERVKRLQDAGLLAGVVTVLSKTNIKFADRFLKFFAANNIPTRLNPILPSERVLSSEEDMSISAVEYADCLIECFDKWMKGEYNDAKGRPIPIAPLTEIVYNFYHTDKPRLCNFSGTCGRGFLAINPIGDIYNCGRFCDIDDFKVANIEDGFENIDDIIEVKNEMIKWNVCEAEKDECQDCEWFSVCNRGCPNSSYLFNGRIMDHDPYCVGYKKLFSHIYNHLKQNASNE